MSAALVAGLCCALAGREGHANGIGIVCKPAWKLRTEFYWRDYYAKESGPIGSVPEWEDCATAAALLEVIKNWREYARRQNRSAARDRSAAPRALAARAAS